MLNNRILNKIINLSTTISIVNNIFVTGMLRSGTTLLDKLLCNHPQLSVLYQPFIELFIEAKNSFYNSINIVGSYHVLHHYFMEDRYKIDDLSHFLSSFVPDKQLLENILQKNNGIHERINPELFLKTFSKLLFEFRHKENAAMYGAKEVLCEEFLPFFTTHGIKCILLIRDPRDVITSLNFGKGKNYGGKLRPTLFNIRNWRKSVAIMCDLQEHKNFMFLRYEDLVENPFEILNSISDFLGTKQFNKEMFENGIYDQKGNLWKGNSSHGKKHFVSNSSVGRFQKNLPVSVQRYIESTCFPEMTLLGYQLNYTPTINAITQFKEPFEINRKDLSRNYSISTENIQQEISRLQLLTNEELGDSDTKFFIFRKAYEKLRNTITC